MLRNVFPAKGFGFVIPDEGGVDLFVHIKDNPGLVECRRGEAVRYDLEWDDRKGNYKGINLGGFWSTLAETVVEERD